MVLGLQLLMPYQNGWKLRFIGMEMYIIKDLKMVDILLNHLKLLNLVIQRELEVQ